MATPLPGKDYLAMVSFLPLKSYWMIPKFFKLSFETERQLAKSRGLIGYSVASEILRRHFWTLSVWEDGQALIDFVDAVPHGRIMRELAPHIGKGVFDHNP